MIQQDKILPESDRKVSFFYSQDENILKGSGKKVG